MAPRIPEQLTLHGKIITLRSLPQEAAYPALQKILSNPTTMQHLQYLAHQPQGWTMAEVEARYKKFLDDMKNDCGLEFVVYLNSDGTVMGNVGYTHIDFEHRSGRTGRIIHHPHWGTGAGSESLLLIWQYGIETLGLHRIEFGTFEDNIRVRKGSEDLKIPLEGVQREIFYENGAYRDSYVYAFFDRNWPQIKKRLEDRISRQITKRGHS